MKKLLLILMLLIPSMALADITKQLTTAGANCAVPTACVVHNIAGYAGATVTLSGTFIATVQFEASSDGTIWSAITGYPVTTGAGVTAATATGNWQFSVGGVKFLRVRCSAITTPPTVNIVGSAGSFTPPASVGAITVGAVDQGTGGASAWKVTGAGGTFPATQSTSPWIVAGGGTAGTPGTAVLTVQGVGSGTAIPISGAISSISQGLSTAYDSTLTGLGNSVASLTATTTVVQMLYCNNSDTSAHTVTVTNTAGGNYVGPSFSIPALSNVVFWESQVGLKMVGVKWGADTANKVYCQISGLQ
jgi:hypothetical protein